MKSINYCLLDVPTYTLQKDLVRSQDPLARPNAMP